MVLVMYSPIDFKIATDNENPLRQIIKAYNFHGIERLVELITGDVVIQNLPFVMVFSVKRAAFFVNNFIEYQESANQVGAKAADISSSYAYLPCLRYILHSLVVWLTRSQLEII